MKSEMKEEDSDPPIKDDPRYQKYFKMKKMGLPDGAVKNALERDRLEPSIVDLDWEKSLSSQTKSSGTLQATAAVAKKKRVRRKKIYWNPIEPDRIKENSLWSLVRGRVQMNDLNYDVKEFENLFTESADPTEQQRRKKQAFSTKPKKLVQVIDGKRSMNGGIILLRLKIDYDKIAEMVDNM